MLQSGNALSLMKIQVSNQEVFQLLLLDLMLSKKHGFEVLEELKKSPDTKAIPVIILTLLGEDGDIKKGLSLGADDYIVKSEHAIGEVSEKIKNFLEKASR